MTIPQREALVWGGRNRAAYDAANGKELGTERKSDKPTNKKNA